MLGRTCSEGHALIKTTYLPVIQLGSMAASFSPNKNIQEYLAHCCSIKSYLSQSTRCWVEEEGSKCQGVPKSFQTWVALPLMLVFDHEDPDNREGGKSIAFCNVLTFIIGWNFPDVITPCPDSYYSRVKGLHYRLVARIQSTTLNGDHFKTYARNTDNMIFELDGMARHIDQKITSISLYGGNGSAPCLNPKGGKKRSISTLVGVQPRTVAVFYVLAEGSLFRTDFFEHQQCCLQRADEEGPIIINKEGLLEFGSLENCINTWVSMYSTPPASRTNWFRLKV